MSNAIFTGNVYTGKQAAEIDRIAIQECGVAGLDLMVEAGEGAFDIMRQSFPDCQRILVFCGSGNNGGDGYVLALSALQAGYAVTVVALSAPKTQDAKIVADRFVADGGYVIAFSKFSQDAGKDQYDLIVDALLGIGLTRAPEGDYAQAIEWMNRVDTPIYALDVPSGVDADTGAVFEPHCVAEMTTTFIVAKLGLLTGSGKSAAGSVELKSLTIPDKAKSLTPSALFLSKPVFPKRHADSHKGSYGSAVIAGGQEGMLGALLLAGSAALRCGAGKVHCLSTEAHLDQPALYQPELMSHVLMQPESSGRDFVEQSFLEQDFLEQATVIAVGPGLGQSAWSHRVYSQMMRSALPKVLDADALNILATAPTALGENTVITPHPGEAARLLQISNADIQCDRLSAVKKLSERYQCHVVLKGAGTLVRELGGEVWVCPQGNPGMASAGMGDVLTGMIAAFIGQGMSVVEASKAAVWLHSYTADQLAQNHGEMGLLASDVIGALVL